MKIRHGEKMVKRLKFLLFFPLVYITCMGILFASTSEERDDKKRDSRSVVMHNDTRNKAEKLRDSELLRTVNSANMAYFEVGFNGENTPFVIQLLDASKIEHARRILRGERESKTHIKGHIVKHKAPYNPKWSYHLDPSSIDFFEMSIEVCDASPKFVEDNLKDVGRSTLPGNHWCPWHSRLTKEVTFSKSKI